MLAVKLIDKVWATIKPDSVNGLVFMLAEVISGRGAGEHIIVADILGAGIGDRVIVSTGSAAGKMLGDDNIPVDAVVIGIIDPDCDF